MLTQQKTINTIVITTAIIVLSLYILGWLFGGSIQHALTQKPKIKHLTENASGATNAETQTNENAQPPQQAAPEPDTPNPTKASQTSNSQKQIRQREEEDD